ncbi:leucine rich adaptor protein 1-like [Cololabis saira]|uniref:leucine rich adaptor protein 1-like n=1 Tax=Cololabis saira TaxID=129043 RepID=UPI002AD393CC|nr:leucine rich adaptor protein 1-like [Cololabis saira]
MAEEILCDSFPDLNELENKIGRKTPESLLAWMRDAADCEEDGWTSDALHGGDSNFCDNMCDKINSLKQEMKQLRSADVRILRQLVAVHEGIEAMRWLMEERGALTSRGSSLTGSLSSLVIAEEQGCCTSPCRKSPSPAFPLDVAEISGERPADQKSVAPDDGCVTGFELQEQDSEAAHMQNIRGGAETIRRALLRSSRAKRPLKVDSDSSPGQPSEKSSGHPAQESFTPPPNNAETMLLGYDAQWCWVESQDDVTFL